jgi:hypothetical protein
LARFDKSSAGKSVMSMRVKVLGVMAALVLLGAANTAEARRYERSDEDGWEESAPRRAQRKHRSQRVHADRGSERASDRTAGARPRQWCGWWMRTRRGGGPEYNLAWSWSRWGSPSEPRVGAVVVWRHHVGEITGRARNGQWIVRSGNDGGRVRERPRSVSGAVFRIGSAG